MSGILYVVGTPIGNLSDFSPRAVETLANVDFIAAEDTRVTLKLLNHFDIKKEMVSYYEHNKRQRGEIICQRILNGENCAIVTDAGMPAISDPGEDLVALCYELGIEVQSVPGPTAFATALAVSGLPTGRFTFEGFLSVNKKSRREHLEEVKDEKRTMIFYEAPHRLKKTLALFCELLGENHRIAICKELTKKHETALHFTLGEAVAYYEANEPKGEFVLVLEGKSAEDMNRAEQEKWQEMPLPKHMKIYEDKGLSRKEAMKAVAKDRGVSKREIYAKLLEDE